jgi:hypothetical protein
MLLSIGRGEKICAAIRPLALLLLCLSGNTCDVGERPPAKGCDSLLGPFRRVSRASESMPLCFLKMRATDKEWRK